ncbi:MAG: electron transport complex subunit E [Eubacteriales bacterium]|nr:electron transport complex subunit E [Eubacteriales bacterium]MDD4323353.1 electron transport complex subunit E [Eubacteriales bacterium]MDD4540929.1 electron transport complex subunit E [Eubacteriales bacterium]
MANKNKSLSYEFIKGIVKENPLFVLVLGTCPALAVTTSAINGLGMGVAFTFVLLMSNVVISALRKVIPDSVRIPAYITIIASLVTIVQFLLKAYTPELDQSLGIFIPLITVNCIILGRAEAFANRNGILASIMDALGMGVGFTLALLLMGGLREILGFGTFFGLQMPWISEGGLQPIGIFGLPAGGFAIFGVLVALFNKLNHLWYSRKPDDIMDRRNYPGSISERTDAPFVAASAASEGSEAVAISEGSVPEPMTKPGERSSSSSDKD